tara:strand:+ start:2382 stop:2552 length:171 start_codon:yes stop_codon:yes gene_type:complete
MGLTSEITFLNHNDNLLKELSSQANLAASSANTFKENNRLSMKSIKNKKFRKIIII